MDAGVTLSIIVSAALVVVEYLVLLWVKSRVCASAAELEGRKLIETATRSGKTSEEIELAYNALVKNRRSQATLQVLPGPEVCFLALTIEACLLLIVPKLDDTNIHLLSPSFLSAEYPVQQLFVMFILALVAWIGTAHWRERIAIGVQQQNTSISIASILAIAGATIGMCIYLFLGGR